jgi:hypothetical protein
MRPSRTLREVRALQEPSEKYAAAENTTNNSKSWDRYFHTWHRIVNGQPMCRPIQKHISKHFIHDSIILKHIFECVITYKVKVIMDYSQHTKFQVVSISGTVTCEPLIPFRHSWRNISFLTATINVMKITATQYFLDESYMNYPWESCSSITTLQYFWCNINTFNLYFSVPLWFIIRLFLYRQYT